MTDPQAPPPASRGAEPSKAGTDERKDVSFDLSAVEGRNLTARLEALLRRHLAEGAWGVKELIPTEIEIAHRAGVSRNTARTAIQRLVSDGLLERVKGYGTFVTPPRVPIPVGAARIRETIQVAMPSRVSRIVRDEMVVPPRPIADAFGLAEGEKLYSLERVRYRMVEDSRPVMYHYVWLLPEYAPHIDKRRLTLGQLQDQLRDRCGLVPARITETLTAVTATADIAAELEIRAGAPLLLLEEKRFDETDRLYTVARLAIVPHVLRLEFEHPPEG